MPDLTLGQDLIPLTMGLRKYGLSYQPVWSKLIARQIEGEMVAGRWWVSEADLQRLSRERAGGLQLV